ncbi:MAG: rubrerythrin [Bacteroidia bacterium]|nr:ferritin family protein [Bacteroidales bacterium]NCD41804.1 rubrerythrin [Bacteroidia bacterium]
MKNETTLEILKQAILLEKRGMAFYTAAANSSGDPDVKNLFMTMAGEESDHMNFLSQQYRNYEKGGKFEWIELPATSAIADSVLTKSLSEKINAAGYEAAAISSAIELENRAIELYAKRAENAEDQEEKEFYNWLADWERGHHELLYKLDQELKERIWNDNSFWPF